MSLPNFAVAVPLLAILAFATVSDLRTRRIPNGLSLGGAALGLLINAFTFGASGLALAVVGCLLCVGCLLPLYVSGGTAAGDVKLMGTVGAFLGPVNGFYACLLALMAGASLAALCLAWRNLAAHRLSTQLGLKPAPAVGNALDKIPYAAAIALGATGAVLQPLWLTTLLGATE